MSRCSGDSFNAATACDPGFPSLTRVRTFARWIEISATSALEKNADRRMQMIKSRISKVSWIIVLHIVLLHAYFDYA